MNTSVLNFTLIKTPDTKYSDAQIFLREFTGRDFARGEAAAVWSQVLDHKWNMSRKLQRDAGLRVAAIDFIENFYAPQQRNQPQTESSDLLSRASRKLKKLVRAFFEAKGQGINY